MNTQSHFNLNLASHPVRNRKLFFSLAGFLGVLFLIFIVAGGIIFWSYRTQVRDIRADIAVVEDNVQSARRADIKYTSQIDEMIVIHKGKVDFINNIIFEKSFSWTDFLSRFERILPESCYIVSLVPSIQDNSDVIVRFKVACPNLDDLLTLINALNDLGYQNVRLMHETRGDDGLFIYEMSLRYERTN